MSHAALEAAVNAAWEMRDSPVPTARGEAKEAVEATLEALGRGEVRVAERGADNVWRVNEWTKKAVLLSFRLQDMEPQSGGPQGSTWWDKVDSKFKDWDAARWRDRKSVV